MAEKIIISETSGLPQKVSFSKDTNSSKYQGIISIGFIVLYAVVGSRAMVLRSLKLVLSDE